jgi:hypothetical protein
MTVRWLLLSSLVALTPAACSSSSVEASDAGRSDAPPGIDAAPESSAPDAGSICNDLANDAPTITVEEVASDPPAQQGGTIGDGTYFLTAAVIYTGSDGPSGATGTAQTTLEISGSTVQQANSGSSTTYTLATSGSNLTATQMCPTADVRQATYTATAATLVVEVPAGTDEAGAKTLVETFAKQ